MLEPITIQVRPGLQKGIKSLFVREAEESQEAKEEILKKPFGLIWLPLASPGLRRFLRDYAFSEN